MIEETDVRFLNLLFVEFSPKLILYASKEKIDMEFC